MHITTLSLHDFRNIPRLELNLHHGVTVLYGPNASGKSSLLEALFFIATTRSHQVSFDREMIHWHAKHEIGTAPFCRLVANVQRTNGPLLLEVIVQLREPTAADKAAGGKSSRQRGHGEKEAQMVGHKGPTHKLVRINRKNVRAIDLVGHLRVVLFTPDDLILVEGSPSDRRRYLDTTLSQLEPRYVHTLSRYNKLIQQRNSLLRAYREHRRSSHAIEGELGYWDRELSRAAGYVLAERLRAVEQLNEIIGPRFQTIMGGEQHLTMSYWASFALDRGRESGTRAERAEEITKQMQSALRSARQEELQRGQTLIGPHRDDLTFLADGVDLGVYGSRGQKRSVALSLKLGEAELMYARSGETPILLLDDLLSELDMQRRSHILQVIRQSNQQTLITTTDLAIFDAAFLQHAHCLRVEGGRVYAVSASASSSSGS